MLPIDCDCDCDCSAFNLQASAAAKRTGNISKVPVGYDDVVVDALGYAGMTIMALVAQQDSSDSGTSDSDNSGSDSGVTITNTGSLLGWSIEGIRELNVSE